MPDEIEFWQSGEWTMVYLNGELVKYGDHYLADEWLQERFGVIVVSDEKGFSVPDGHHPIESLAEVKASLESWEEQQRSAAALRQQAADLLAEAERMEA